MGELSFLNFLNASLILFFICFNSVYQREWLEFWNLPRHSTKNTPPAKSQAPWKSPTENLWVHIVAWRNNLLPSKTLWHRCRVVQKLAINRWPLKSAKVHVHVHVTKHVLNSGYNLQMVFQRSRPWHVTRLNLMWPILKCHCKWPCCASQHLRWEKLNVAPFASPTESNWWCGDHPMRWLQSNVCVPLRDFAPACADFSPQSWYSNIWWHFPPTTWPILCYDASSICPAPVEQYMIFTESQWESATFIGGAIECRPKVLPDKSVLVCAGYKCNAATFDFRR